MKKIILPLIFLFSLVVILNNANAGDRKVFLERFTSSTCGPCASANPTFDSFLGTIDPNKIVSISYHMNWPSPGNDPMYLANPADNTSRRTNYGVNAIPYWIFDGVIQSGQSFGSLQNGFNTRTDILSPVTIILTESRNGSTVNSRVEVYCESVMPVPNATLHFVVVEKLITYSFPPGTNGETNFPDVMRKMLPGGLGTAITLLPGRKITMDYTYQIDPSWQPAQVRSVAFVQAAPLEILNTSTLTTDFNLMSTPGVRVVNQGQSQNADFKAHIPSIAEGFDSPVTFTAEVLPATPGITATFTNGNVISNFPDSVNLNVASTSSVPVGEYKVVITGTSATGKVHKTAANYLVGKSYIITGTNRNLVSYKVDDVPYTTARAFTWDVGSNHTLEATSPQTFGNFRYVYSNWSNGGPQSQTVTINTTDVGYTANYKVQYRMLGQLEPAGLPVTITGANGYYDSASVNYIGVSATQVQHNGETYYFNRWEGTGSGSYTGPVVNAQITMNSVIIQKAVYTTDVGISNYNSLIPDKFALHQNFPNPFNPTTAIRFDIPKSSHTSIIMYDMLGKEVANLVNQNLTPGSYQYTLNANNFPSGIYYYKISTESFTDIKKMMLFK